MRSNKVLSTIALIIQLFIMVCSTAIICYLRYYYGIGDNSAERVLSSVLTGFLGTLFYGYYLVVCLVVLIYTVVSQIILGVKMRKIKDLPKKSYALNILVYICTVIFFIFSVWVVNFGWVG